MEEKGMVPLFLESSECPATLGRLDALRATVLRDLRESGLQEPQDVVQTPCHGALDHVDVHDLVLPHIVIGDGGETAVAHPQLPRELTLGDHGHTDDVREVPEHEALCPGGEPGALDAQVPPTHVVLQSQLLRRVLEHGVQIGAEGLGYGDVYDPVIEVGVVPPLGEVDELVGDDQVPGDELLLKGSDRTCGDDVGTSQLLQRPHVGPVGDGGRRVGDGRSVAVEECDLHPGDPPDEDLIRGFPVGCVGVDLLDEFEGVRVVDPGSAYYRDLRHVPSYDGIR